MVMNAAAGRTQQQIAQELNIFEEDLERLNEKYKEILNILKHKKNIIKVANKIYVAEEPSKQISMVLDNNYALGKKKAIDKLDFKKGPKKVADMINSYVAKVTHDKIKDLVSPKDIRRDTACIGINAFFFKGFSSSNHFILIMLCYREVAAYIWQAEDNKISILCNKK